MSTSIPVVMTTQGAEPTDPATLLQALINYVSAKVPGFTVNLPGTLIEDISSTDVGAMALIDQARVDAINSVTPYGANAYLLNQLGAMLGIPQGQATNTSVYVQFSGTAGYVLPAGFTVSDGSHQYALADGGVIGANGLSPQLYAVATQSGSWPVGANGVTQIVTSVPSGYTLSVNNPQAGTPGQTTQLVSDYRAQIISAFSSPAQGIGTYLTARLQAIPGVTPRLVRVVQRSGGWSVVCGSGDSYEIAQAIYSGVVDLSTILGSQLAISNITAANPAVVTTNLDSNLAVGATFTVTGATPSGYNQTYTVASVSGTSITTSTDTSSLGTYTSGATFSPNPRDISVSVTDPPNSYSIVFVNPPAQVVTGTVTWNTTLPSFTAGGQVTQLAATTLQSYINSIPVGQPINLLDADSVFQEAVSSILSKSDLTTLTYSLSVNGSPVSPSAGTSIINSDPEGYFSAASGAITVTQG